MIRDTSEPLRPGVPYPPNVEYTGMVAGSEAEPMDFRAIFRRECSDLYAGDALEALKASGYDPVIIGYTHGSLAELDAIKKKIEGLQVASDHTLVMLQEITPQQLQWIKDFLAAEARFKIDGTVDGRPARHDEARHMAEYRRRLEANHGQALSLWGLENGIDVRSIEHPQVKQWVAHDSTDDIDEEDEELSGPGTPPEFYAAIRRDIHGLETIEAERPDIVSVGYLHALKYDMLLDRDGRRTFYYLSTPLRWREILRHWVDSHGTTRS